MVLMLKPSVGQISSMLSPLNFRTTVVLPARSVMTGRIRVIFQTKTCVVEADHKNSHFALLLAHLLGRKMKKEGN